MRRSYVRLKRKIPREQTRGKHVSDIAAEEQNSSVQGFYTMRFLPYPNEEVSHESAVRCKKSNIGVCKSLLVYIVS